MKRLFVYVIFFIGFIFNIQSQKIDNSNYYKHQILGNIKWLSSGEAVPVIIDELIKNKIGYHQIAVGTLLKLNDSTRVIVTVSFYINHKAYGFIYDGTHYVDLDVSHRDFMKTNTNCNYTECERTTDDQVKCMDVNSFPENIFLLRETCYWFQTKPDGSNAPITKKIAINILRQDIREYLKRI